MPTPRTGSDTELTSGERARRLSRRAATPHTPQQVAESPVIGARRVRRARRAAVRPATNSAGVVRQRRPAQAVQNRQGRRVGIVTRVRRAARDALRNLGNRLEARDQARQARRG